MQTHASIKKESKERAQEEEAREKKLTKKRTAVAGNRTLSHLQIGPYTAVYRTYGVYIRSAKTHIRSYGYGTGGSMSYTVPEIRRTEETAYIRSYGLGQPYLYSFTCGSAAKPGGFL